MAAAVKVLAQMTLGEMRVMFTDQFQQLREGKTTAANINAFANLGGKYLQSIKLELEAIKMLGQVPTNIQSLLAAPEGENTAANQSPSSPLLAQFKKAENS